MEKVEEKEKKEREEEEEGKDEKEQELQVLGSKVVHMVKLGVKVRCSLVLQTLKLRSD